MKLATFLSSHFLFFAVASRCLAAVSQPVSNFTAEDLSRLINKSQVRTIETLLPLLPTDLRRNVTFVVDSESVQKGDKDRPRAVLWDELGGLVLTFNGGGDQEGGDTLEFLQVDPQTQKLHFYELRFPLKAGSDGRINAIPAEPTSCLQCHGKSPRPIWQEYPVWPKLFGAQDDFSLGEQAKAYADFSAKASSHARYRHLFPDPDDTDWHVNFPFRSDNLARPTRMATAFTYRPNLRLGAYFTRINAQRLLRILKESPLYALKKEILLWELMDCDGKGDGLGAVSALKEFGLSPEDFDLRTIHDDPANKTLDFQLSYFDGSASVVELLVGCLLEDVKRSSPGLQDLTFALRGLLEKYDAAIPRNQIDWPLFSVLDKLGKWFPLPYAINPITKFQHREPFIQSYKVQYDQVCSKLKAFKPERPPQALSNPNGPNAGSEDPGWRILQSRCARCHSGTLGSLAFDNLENLRKNLKEGSGLLIDKISERTLPGAQEGFRMPFRAKPLTSEERDQLISFLRKLTHF